MDKKTKFAAYITAKRKAAGLTQRELADRLFVTNTAVSKWERGLSLPDVTLITPICDALNITPQEFIDAGDDIAAQKAKVESGYYKKIALRYHGITLGAYSAALIVCLIVDIVTTHSLSWSLIVLPSVLFAASLTNLPFAVRHLPEKHRTLLTVADFVAPLVFLLLILLSTGIYVPLGWLPTAYLGILLGYSVCVLPFLLKAIRLPRTERILICLTAPVLLLWLLLLQVCIHTGGTWFFVSALGVLTGYTIFVLPALLYNIGEFTRKWNLLISSASALISAGALAAVAYFQYFA